MGMPEQKPQSGMNIAPDGTIYEILDDGTIKRIGKVSPGGSFEPFGNWKCPSCGSEDPNVGESACGENYAYAVGAPQVIECNS